jgi:MFS family permease
MAPLETLLLLQNAASTWGSSVVGKFKKHSEKHSVNLCLLCSRPQVAPTLGPLFGGLLTQLASWRWTFGFLALLSAMCFGLMAIALPETARTIVGDGSIPTRGLSKSLMNMWRDKRSGRLIDPVPTSKRRFTIPNPLESAHIFFYKDTMPVILIYAISYTNYCCLQASLSSLFITLYGFRELAAGAIYIPFGVGCFLASFLSGKVFSLNLHMVRRH